MGEPQGRDQTADAGADDDDAFTAPRFLTRRRAGLICVDECQ